MARQVVRYVPAPPTEIAAARTRRARRQLARVLVVVLAVAAVVAVPLVRADAATPPRGLHAVDGATLTDHIGAQGRRDLELPRVRA